MPDKNGFIYNSITNHLINCSNYNPKLVAINLNTLNSNIPLFPPPCSSQLLINGVWIIINPAHAIHHYPTREDNLLVCDSYIDASYMIAFFYPIVLIVICTIYAVLTRKIPEAFNESKHIGESITIR